MHTACSSSCLLGVSASVHAGIHPLGLGLDPPGLDLDTPATSHNLTLGLGLDSPSARPLTFPLG